MHLSRVHQRITPIRPEPQPQETESFLPGERTNTEGKPIRNQVLLSLPSGEFKMLRPYLVFEELAHHATLHEPGQKLEFIYFPNSGIVSLVVATREGKTVEVGVVGHEGIVGIAAAAGLNRAHQRSIVQIAGEGMRISAEIMQSLLPSSPVLQTIVTRHAVIQGMQAAQSAACNRLHGIEHRLARWLLIMQDRVDNGSLHITHDFLATLLGTDRPSVSLAAALLQRKGTIGYTRGAIRIVNRKLLEEATCECYSVMQQFNGLLGLR